MHSPILRRPSWRLAAEATALGLAAFVILGFWGGISPAFDSMGHLRGHASVALVVAAFALFAVRRPIAGIAAIALGTLGLYSIAPFMLPAQGTAEAGAPRYTLLQMNLRWDAPDRGPALSLIARLRPDVVTAQEVTAEWKDDFARLSSAYPYQFYCREPFGNGSDTAILSRRSFINTAATVCNDNGALAARRIDFNGLAVTIGSQHLRWPWPGRQTRMVTALLPDLERLDGPTVIAGDFNATPWSASIARYAAASRTRVLAGIGPSWLSALLPLGLARFVGLPIDNVLVSNDVQVLTVSTLAPTASDHLPVLVTFTMRFALPEEPDVQSAAR